MRIQAVELSWFRGAADPIVLEPNCKSMVVYGENGSGKSSFVDAIEYVLNEGKIHHLAHEYSGKHQEKAVPNTHRPQGRKTELKFKFKDDSQLVVEIRRDGSWISSGGEAVAMAAWDYQRTVLRQDEVAAFIHETKGGKYSVLLPLLGLHEMEVAAENLRQVARAIEQQSRLMETRVSLRQTAAKRTAVFGAGDDEEIVQKIENLYRKYCPEAAHGTEMRVIAPELESAINTRIERFTADHKRYLTLQGAAELDVKGCVDAVRTVGMKLAGSVEPLIAEKLEILQSSGAFVRKLGDKREVDCPSCGRSITADTFRAHVDAESERLQEVIDTFNTRKAAIGALCDTVKSLKSSLNRADVKPWRDQIAKTGLADNFAYLDKLDAEKLCLSYGQEELGAIEENLLPLIAAAASSSEGAPADVQQLSTDKQMIQTANIVIGAKDQVAEAARAESLIAFIKSLEHGIREEIRTRSQTVIDEITADLKDMWAILHPGKAIEDVRFYLPKSTDKAIDIALKFHGVAQDSPRLTLSEGYRNSLGLCIFLAMAKREAKRDRPLVLDDVVVSLDRNHRGLIVELLEKEFGDRQVIILTHDRDWYTELRHQLEGKNWSFKTLLPYETPDIGIRWSHKTTTFDDARAHLKDRPDSAGNDVRKIMDVELALIGERLHIRLPYLRAEKNDRRMAHEFLERLVADGKQCFQKRDGKDYAANAQAIAAFDNADRLLLSWANRGSHTFDVIPAEAAKLIDACEKALELFKCSSCGKGVWFAEVGGSEWVQCQCGQIRWRYGKA